MSDDFDLDEDDLFNDPASLAAIEQAVATAERNAKPPQRQESGRGGNGTVGNAAQVNGVAAGNRYHHAVAPSTSALRGRGVQQNGSIHSGGVRPQVQAPGMGMRPRPPGTANTTPQPAPARFIPPQPNPQPTFRPPVSTIHQLSRPVVVPTEEEEEEYGPEFSVDEFGKYFESEVKDVRRQGFDASVREQVDTAQGNGAVHGMSGARGMTKSPSLGPTSIKQPHNPPSESGNRATITRASPAPGNTNQYQAPPKRPFQRVPSTGGDARRMAIMGSQGTVTAGMGSQSTRAPVGSQNGHLGSQAATTGAERPSVAAGIGNQEIEELRKQVAQMAKEKNEIEERERKAVSELWRYQGEAKNVRLKADEEKKHAEGKFTTLQKQLADLEETLKAERLGHKRALDTVQTDHAFKMHNEQSSHVKARFGTTQRSRTGHHMQSTPSRTSRAGVTASQQGASQVPNITFDYTPTRSPTKRPGPQGGRPKLGNMGPPPVPDLNVGFMTPKPLTASSRKARVLESKNRNTPNSNFRGLHDAFAGDATSQSFKKQKTGMNVDAADRGAGTPSVFEYHDQDAPDHEMQEAAFQPVVDDVDRDEDMELPQEDIIVEVNHIIFTHFYTPVWESANDSMKTVQRILTCHNPSRESFPLFQEKCSLFLEACGNREATALDYCRHVNQALWELLSIIIEEKDIVAPATIVSLMQLLTLLKARVPHYAEVFSLAAPEMPRNILEDLIAQYWPLPEPTLAAGKSAPTPISADDEPESTALPRAFRIELGYAMCAMLGGVQSTDGEAPACFAAFASSSRGIRRLISANSPISVVVDALDLLSLMSCDVELFRPLLSLKPEQNSQEVVDPKKPPLVDSLSVYLKQDHSEASVQTGATICHRVLSIICNLCRVHADGLTLLGNSFHLVPSLVQLAETLTNHIWGICASDEYTELHFGVLVAVITVLHMLIFPPESPNGSTPGVHLRTVIARALESPKEYNGLHHVFITALGRISYAPVPEMKQWSRMQVTTLRYLAQDLLSELLGGNQKEDDSIFALFVPVPLDEAAEAAAPVELPEGPNAEEEAESLARMEIIVISDD